MIKNGQIICDVCGKQTLVAMVCRVWIPNVMGPRTDGTMKEWDVCEKCRSPTPKEVK